MLEVSILEISRNEGELPYKEIQRSFTTRTKLGGVNNFQGFLKVKEEDTNAHRNYFYGILQEKLLKLQEYLKKNNFRDTDPIRYLGYLYYDEQLSLKDISTRLMDEGIEFSSSGLKRNFNDVFNWILRDNYEEENEVTRKKHTSKFKPTQVLAGKKKKREEEINALKEKAEDLLDGIIEQDIYKFDILKYKRYKKDFDKIKYIFDIYYSTPIYELIRSLKKESLSLNSIAIIINNLCKELIILNQPTIKEYPETNKTTISNII